MTTKVTIVLLAVALASGPAMAREVTAGLLVDPVVHSHPSSRDPGDQCDRGHGSYYWTIDSWFTGEESYAVYCDPSGCPDCSGSWRPLSVTIYLYWEEENACALTLHAEILDADLSEPSCPSPGSTVIATSAPVTAGPFSPAGLWAVTVDLPEECDGLSEPFFASIVFEDACGEPPDLVADAGPCIDCESWNDWDIGWDELCAYGFPGNLSIYATLECSGSSPVRDATWTTIKTMYR
ncbi:MAG: hypothetical protein GF400_01610 [Candidatus Eisenbacteria bacterium]|nr:hypothetical protein [Candidatus Eisenbacteria bacterium]